MPVFLPPLDAWLHFPAGEELGAAPFDLLASRQQHPSGFAVF